MSHSKKFDLKIYGIAGATPSSAKLELTRALVEEVLDLCQIVREKGLVKVVASNTDVEYVADFSITGEELNVGPDGFWFSGEVKSNGAVFETSSIPVHEAAKIFGLPIPGQPSPEGDVLPGATREEIDSVMMEDIVGPYDTPDQVPEWAWVEANASFGHRQNGENGIWEFVLNLSISWSDIPDRLAGLIAEARQKNLSYLIVHQGT